MAKRRCAACGGLFAPRRNVPDQRYCSEPVCQRARRRRWQRDKRQRDADYRANQAAAQRAWCARHRDYWRRYRRSHPQYSARNRERQRARNRHRRRGVMRGAPAVIAKMPEYEAQSRVPSGTYRLIPVPGPGIAKMDAYLVEMRVLSEA